MSSGLSSWLNSSAAVVVAATLVSVMSTRAAGPTNGPAVGVVGGTNSPSATTNGAPAGVIDAETRELKPRDTFRFRIDQDPTSGAEPQRVTITDSGEAYFNVSRGHSAYVTVKAAGRRIAEVRKEVREKLNAEYYIDATINLDLEGLNIPMVNQGGGLASAVGAVGKIQVFGEMQGAFPIPETGKLMLSDVILALPRNDFAQLKKIRVQRTNPDGQPETHVVNIDKVLNGNDRSADFELKDGDRVQVPRKTIVGF